YAEAFAAETRLAKDQVAEHCYNAACSAALAGCGQGKDAARLDSQERALLRRQALDWLRADVQAYMKLLESGKPDSLTLVQQRLQHWQRDDDLIGVRDPAAIAKLPPDEQDSWRELWAKVGTLHQRARGPQKK